MRIGLTVATVLVLCGLAALQAVSSIALRERAQPGAWVGLVPATTARRVDRLDPSLPLPSALRIVLTRKALDAGELSLAAAHLARLPPSHDRAALYGRLAEARGDETTAVAAYLEAGDLDGLERRVAALEEAHRFADALALQQATVERLRADPTQADALAEAYWHLGRVQQAMAYQLWPTSPERRAAQLRSAEAYRQAVQLAPFSARYLIAAGNQELNLGRLTEARRDFARVHDVDPSSVGGYVGLGEVALRSGDMAAAKGWLVQAQRQNATAPEVRRLARALGE
ncbi:MAG: hypothetical protein JO103_10305 [Candidatus Eremiobacteraeota bacterium]|nr:hypothetical protein [Candidatus Eremiobacteraeota bacterium]MBV9409290.1 hypothetical protein [Candidatus Eremiobacteraeota bacterium]